MNKKIWKIVCVICLISIQLLQGFTVCAEEGEKPLRVVRVATGFTNALYLDEEGHARGYCASYLKQIAWLENWKLEYVEGTWNESVKRLYDGEIDILLPTQMTEERKEKMGYSQYAGGYEAVGLYARENTEIWFNDYENMDCKVIGVEKNTSNLGELDSFAKHNHITYKKIEMDNVEQMMNALNEGTIDLAVCNTTNEINKAKLVAILDYLPFYYCTAIENKELLAELNDGMRDVMINSPDMTTKVFDSVMKGTTEVGYTKEEAAIIANTDQIVVGMYDNCLPLSGTNENGQVIGIYVDILNSLSQYVGIEMKPYLIDNDEFLYDYLDDGTVDYVMSSMNLAYMSENVNNYLGSDNITDYFMILVTRPDYVLNTKRNITFAITENSQYLEDTILKEYPNAKFQHYKDAKECMTAIQKKKVDAAYLNSWEYNYQTKNARFQNMKEWENTRLSSDLIVTTLKKTDVAGLAIMDKAINQLSNETIENVIASNLNMSYISSDSTDKWYNVEEGLKIYGSIIFIILVIFAVYIIMKLHNEKSLKEKNLELQMANKAKSDFLSRMSHELRTPINAILGYTDLMEENIRSSQMDTEVLCNNIATTKRATGYLLAIISDLLDIQGIETGKIQITEEIVNAEDFMKNVVDMVEQEATVKNLHFVYERQTDLHDEYLADGVRFQQILLNILHNAIKFTPDNGTVKMLASEKDIDEEHTLLTFIISDTGIGMSEEYINKHLYKKFAQENQDISSPYDGCGIGLALSKQLLDLMGGTITCESKKGVGTTFQIEFIAKPIHKKKRRVTRKDRPSYDLTGVRVLLCEDNEVNQEMEKQLLMHMKCEVDIAEDGKVGLYLFQNSEENYYHIILMDIRMPNMDGWEATKAIRNLNRKDAKTVPILAVSANAFEEDIQESMRSGMNEHLSKPVDGRVLFAKISQYCKTIINS